MLLASALLLATQAVAENSNYAELIGKAVLWAIGSLALLEKLYGWVTGGAKKKEAALQAWQAKQEACNEEVKSSLGQFMNKDHISQQFAEGRKANADLVLHVTQLHQQHERLEDKTDGRFTNHESQLTHLASLHPIVSQLGRDHVGLAAKVDNIVSNQERMERKQDENFRMLFDLVKSQGRAEGKLEAL